MALRLQSQHHNRSNRSRSSRTQSYSSFPICEDQQKEFSFTRGIQGATKWFKTNLSVVKIRIGPYAVEGIMDFGAGLTAIDAKLATLLSREWYAWEGPDLQLADGRSIETNWCHLD